MSDHAYDTAFGDRLYIDNQHKVLRAVVAALFVIEECLTLGSGIWLAAQVGSILTEEPSPSLSKSLGVQRTTAIPVPMYIAIW